ncbi:MAG: asparagine synthase C-terminal domain-containing protein [Thermoplasmata archaeon]|nr:asparagine synthase C-terminal domain-containing protein [Thermoplasmata archaeon]
MSSTPGADVPPPSAGDLLAGLTRAVHRCCKGTRSVSVLFSGGVDSSLLAKLFSQTVDTDLVCVGFPNSPDVGAAKTAADALALPLTCHLLSDADIDATLRSRADVFQGMRPQARSVALATALALDVAPQVRVAMGQGADELFLGYAHFQELTASEARVRAHLDLSRLMDSDWPLALRLAKHAEKELVAPYLDPEMLRMALSVPIEAHLSNPLRKPVLREMARLAGLPEAIVNRPKRAFQYGSRVDAALRRQGRLPS